MKNKHTGSNFDDFLKEEGIYDEVNISSTKRAIAYKVKAMMEKLNLSKTTMAYRMGTSRSSLERLLDPENTSVTLDTLSKAATVVGKRLDIRLMSKG